jgi:hypothetical protein
MAKRKKTALPGEIPSVDDIMRYEQGDMTQEETVTFFQKLIDSGMAWRLQGCYGRMAASLIENGLCKR